VSGGRIATLAAVGLVAGFCSGLFGVGGGIILVPLLVLVLGVGQRRASATTLAAMLPTSLTGTAGYALQGHVYWLAGGILIAGAVSGAVLGSWLLHRIPQRLLRWVFIVFLLAVAVRMIYFIPDRASDLELTLGIAAGLIGLGAATGMVSGLLGVGGGAIAIPGLMLLFAFGDLTAKGTSLFMMIPTAMAGTLGNLLRGYVDLKVAVATGSAAVLGTIAGVTAAVVVSPQWSSILFAILLLYSAAHLLWHNLRGRNGTL
jgi:uncharacterized membrane protein YfcA